MDVLVGGALVFTFVSLLLISPMVIGLRRPPALRRSVRCPEDHAPATVAVSWEPEQRRMLVTDCDHSHMRNGRCRKSCEGAVQHTVPELTPTIVMP